jgi:uncharacterized membrane protein YqjE
MPDPAPGSVPGGLHGAAGRLSAAAVSFVHTRAELAATEFEEARERAKERLLLGAVAGICFAVALLAATAYVVVLFLDTYRLTALAAVTLAYVLGGALALWRLNVRQKSDPRPFAATLAELERDRQWIADKFGDKP